MLPIEIPAYSGRRLQKDLVAGLTVGVVAIPLAMAFAIAAGVKPEFGMYTTIIAAVVVAIFGGSRYQVTGPTGAFIPVLLSIVLTYGYNNLLLAGFLAGVILVVMGLLKMGTLIKFIPRPVTIGFTAGIAVNIFVGQIPDFFGLTGLQKQEGFIASMQEIITHLSTINPYSVVTAVLCLSIILITPRFWPKVPGSLIGLIVSSVTAYLLYPSQVNTIATAFGQIPSSLPQLKLPDVSLANVQAMLRPGIAIAALGAIESLLSAVVADGMTGKKHNSNKELIGQGLANMVVPLFGGIPATGAVARTATNIKSGATSRVSIFVQSGFVLLTLLFLAPYASNIPLASMAPILMVVAYNMCERKQFASVLRTRSNDAKVLMVTFLFTVLTDLTTAVEVGLLLAMVIFVKRMSDIMVVAKVLPNPDDRLQEVSAQTEQESHGCKQISIFTVEGPLFFGAAQSFSQTIMATINLRPRFLILRMSEVPFMDLTGEASLSNIVQEFHKHGGQVLISGLKPQPRSVMKTTGLHKQIGSEHFFQYTEDAISFATAHVKHNLCRSCEFVTFKECKKEASA